MPVKLGETFEWRGMTLPYLDHPYNRTTQNERAIEVPIAQAWLEGKDPAQGLEIGNVLGHYQRLSHHVVDLYEMQTGVENIDVFDVEGEYDWIVAISTLEHVYSDWPGGQAPHPTAGRDALAHLVSLLKPGGEMLATIPFGQQPFLDTQILTGAIYTAPDQNGTMVWDWSNDEWVWHEDERIWQPAREWGWARAVWVATWTR